MTKLKNSFNGVVLGGIDTNRIFQAVSDTLLAVADDSDLGIHTSLNELNVAVTPHQIQFNTSSSSSKVESHDVLHETFTRIDNKSSSKMTVVNVIRKDLQHAMGWYHKMEYDQEDGGTKKTLCQCKDRCSMRSGMPTIIWGTRFLTGVMIFQNQSVIWMIRDGQQILTA